MTSVAGFVRVLHDIDAAKGRTCGACRFGVQWRTHLGGRVQGCQLGMGPADETDGCEHWQAWQAHQRPANEHGEAS